MTEPKDPAGFPVYMPPDPVTLSNFTVTDPPPPAGDPNTWPMNIDDTPRSSSELLDDELLDDDDDELLDESCFFFFLRIRMIVYVRSVLISQELSQM